MLLLLCIKAVCIINFSFQLVNWTQAGCKTKARHKHEACDQFQTKTVGL